uniref:Reverse transcriptase domain-containing protein n=1 Tax=Panagrolaimus davidi TaxID=227884 RepID=A0A914R0K0_9BILA
MDQNAWIYMSLLIIAQVSAKPQRGATPVYDINRSKTNVKPKAAYGRLPGTKVSPAVMQSSVNDLQKEFAALFEPGLGRCNKRYIHLQLKANARAIHVPARRMNEQAKEIAKEEIGRLCEIGVMQEFEGGFAEYATPGSIVKRKDGRSRFVVDYSTGLNDQLEESSYQLPVPEDIFDQLSGCSYFTQLDFSDAYHQIPLDEESQHHGRYAT